MNNIVSGMNIGKMSDKLLKPPLLEKIRNYLLKTDSTKEIFLFAPYIKAKTLSKLVDGLNNITIVTTWHIGDLVGSRTSSDLDIYPLCKKNNFKLYVNNEIHLKVYSVGLESAIIASGNISFGGLEGGNEECGAFVDQLSMSDKLFLEKIKANATYIDDDVYQRHLELVEEKNMIPSKKIEFEDLIIPIKPEYFFKSSLPMTRNVDDLIKGYAKLSMGFEASNYEETKDCIIHDLVIYNIEELGLPQDEFVRKLKNQFFSHPFIKKIEEFINPETYFGEMKVWIQKNCKDDPIPRRWELTENTQTLYDWFVKLGDEKYAVDRPNYSQRLYKVTDMKEISSETTKNILKYENEVLLILNEPGLTIEQIKKKYEDLPNHDIHNESSDPSEQENASYPIWHYKDEIDAKIANRFSLTEEEIGERNSRGKLYKQIVEVISKLHDNKYIKFWHYKKHLIHGNNSDGVWKLTDKGKQEIQNRVITNKKETLFVAQENPILNFEKGQFYHHNDIWKPLNLGYSSGIRSSKKNKLVILFWNVPSQDVQKQRNDEFGRVNIYEDSFDEKIGLYHYIGEGKVGNQKLTRGNKAIIEAKELGRTIHLFHQHENNGEHEYLGEVELVGKPEIQIHGDIDGKNREEFVFLLKPVQITDG